MKKQISINEIRRLARSAKKGQWPYLNGLSSRDIQKLMDMSGFPTTVGTVYTVVTDSYGRALRFDGAKKKEVNYEKLPDGSIHIEGIPWELRLDSQGIVCDADGVEIGELTEDKTKIILWEK